MPDARPHTYAPLTYPKGGPRMEIQPYLFFDGSCDEALAFYRSKLGAEVRMLLRFKDAPAEQAGMAPPGAQNKVMHARMQIGQTTILVSDGRCGGNPHFQGMALSLTVATEEEAQRVFTGLSDGGQVQMPLAKTFFSPRFGMLTDRFGVAWMVYVGS